MNNDILSKVNAVNKKLEDQGAAAVQKFAKLKNTGRDIYGYVPQRVFDAMNEVFNPEGGWFHHIVDTNIHEKQVIARVAVTIGNRTCEQFGEHRILGGDTGSAFKSAVTDGIQKCLALFSVGAKAYRGELEGVFNADISKTKQEESPAYTHLLNGAKAVKDKKSGRTWWAKNLVAIQELSDTDRKKLVVLLEKKK